MKLETEYLHVKSGRYFHDGYVRQLDVCVEDIFAKVLLTEVIRRKNKALLKVIAVHDIGNKDAVREAVKVLLRTGKKAIAIRDADVGQNKTEHLYSFPGCMPPEKEVFTNHSVKDLIKAKYGIDFDWLVEKEEVKNHHKYALCIAKEAETDESVIRTVAIEKYVLEVNSEFDELIADIEVEINA
ncbi:MAG: hypothetical protein MZV65_11690 [Chromatiales bacterium]|nr:hypothetical protein [Chromatiales bacterium]